MNDEARRIRTRTIEAEEVGGALLAIDTALGTSVALGAAGRVIEASSDNPLRHAEVIGELLERVFAESGLAPDRVTGVVSGIGPGPFTGLRVGMAAAHAFAAARSVPLLPLQGHEAVALEALEDGSGHDVRVVQDARRRELFVTGFSGLDPAGIPRLVDPAHLRRRADFEEGAHDVWPERIPAAGLARLAARRLAAGRGFEEPGALYLRDPDVKKPGAPKRVST